MTTDYERDIEHIRQLYFKGFYDLLDISRIKKFHPDELINIMMDNSMSLKKRDLGGYSAYKLFNDIDRRLQQIEQKLNNRDNDLYEDIMFEEYNDFEEYYPHIYNILFDDEDDDEEDDCVEYEEDEEEEDENDDTEEEKNENDHAKVEEEKDEGEDPTDKSTKTQENSWGLISLLKKPIIENIFLGAFGEAVFFSAVLGNATIIFFSIVHLFHDYCKK